MGPNGAIVPRVVRQVPSGEFSKREVDNLSFSEAEFFGQARRSLAGYRKGRVALAVAQQHVAGLPAGAIRV